MRFAVLLSLIALVTVRAEKPFDFNTTPGKLPKNVAPQEYQIRIVPDVAKMSFTGSETVKLDVRTPVRVLVLNAADIQVTHASIDGNADAVSGIHIDPKEETLTLPLNAELPPGPHSIALQFTGKINQQGQGLYAAPYQEQGSGARKTMLGTQFEATDARRMFPCWDEPSFRARFQLTAVVPENWTAVSNMPIENEAKNGATKEVRFGMTPSMASYLNVFVAGELDTIEGQSGATKIRVVTTKGKSEMGRYALECTAQILQYYNDYFGVAYPLPKLDQIAVPGGFGGAMENWGGITYYESALLFDPKNSSSETKQNIYAVIAHEMAHQWFGDLVTTAWWDNIWLNEGFASWMGSKCTAHFNPQWEVWNRRNQPRDPTRRPGIPKEAAMEGDARSTTHPIQQPIHNEAEANSAFDDITYQKGQSFLRMLESFLGDDVFRDGIRRYISAHKYSNTTTADLWNALSEASHKPVTAIAAAWTEQPGFPVVNVRRDGNKIALAQERFAIHWPNPEPLLWKIPLTYEIVGDNSATLLMSDKTAEIADVPADRAVKFNVNGTGNYRVQYDDQSWKLLIDRFAQLTPADRVNLLGDSWALVQANRAPWQQYTALVAKLTPASDPAEYEQVIGTLEFVNQLLAGEPQRDGFQKYALGVLRPVFDRLGWNPKADEPPRIGTLRASLVQALGDLGDSGVIAGCRERFGKFAADRGAVPPDLRPAVLALVGRYADEATWNKLHELGMKTTSIEEKGNLYSALAAAQDPKLDEKTMQLALTDELPTSRAAFLVPRVARESEHPDVAWQFAKSHMKQLLAKTDALAANSYAPGLFTFFSDPNRIAELDSYAKSDLPPGAARHVAMAKDEIGFRAELKARLLAEMSNERAKSR